MGAENSILENSVWEGPESAPFCDWVVKKGTLRDDSSVSSISLFTCKKREKKDFELLRQFTKRLKGIRHPSILHFVSSGENTDGPYLVTEDVVPLEIVVKEITSIEICAGIHNLLDGLAFLHDKAGLCHNNICAKSVYVCRRDGSWRLGDLQHACLFPEADMDYLESCRALRVETSIAPEEKNFRLQAPQTISLQEVLAKSTVTRPVKIESKNVKGKVDTSREHGHARDVYAFAVMMEEFMEQLEDLGDMTKTFELRIQDECLSADPKQRPKVQSLLEDRLFTNDFLDIALFLRNVALKTEEERVDVFRNLIPRLLALPEELIGRRLVPLLLSRFVLLDQSADEFMLPHLLTPCREDKRPSRASSTCTPLLRVDIYKKYVIPELKKVLCVHDLHIRHLLLQHFHAYVDLFDKECLEEDIFPQVLLGLRDVNDSLAALSLRALADMVPILGRQVVIGGRAKKYFTDNMPKALTPDLNNKMSNVSGVIKSKLLKDIAKLSPKLKVEATQEEKDKRWKERERRREEARLRREKRRQEMQEAKMKGQKKDDNQVTNERSEPVDSNVEEQDLDSSVYSDQSTPRKHLTSESQTKRGNIPLEETFAVLNSDEAETGHTGSNSLVENSAQNEGEGSDWENWDEGKGDNSVSEENDFSDEIEKELESMSSTVSPRSESSVDKGKSGSKQSNWTKKSKTTEPHSKTGALRLGKSKTKPKEKGNGNSPENQKKIYSSNTSEVAEVYNLEKSSVKTSNKTSSGQISHVKHKPLGSEFEVKSIDVKPASKTNEFDFFSDMTPEIKLSNRGLLESLAGGAPTQEQSNVKSPSKESKSVASFEVQEQSNEVADAEGWGDDLDWGDENF